MVRVLVKIVWGLAVIVWVGFGMWWGWNNWWKKSDEPKWKLDKTKVVKINQGGDKKENSVLVTKNTNNLPEWSVIYGKSDDGRDWLLACPKKGFKEEFGFIENKMVKGDKVVRLGFIGIIDTVQPDHNLSLIKIKVVDPLNKDFWEGVLEKETIRLRQIGDFCKTRFLYSNKVKKVGVESIEESLKYLTKGRVIEVYFDQSTQEGGNYKANYVILRKYR